MRRLNALGERITSRDPARETAEVQTHVALMTASVPTSTYVIAA